MTKILEIKTAYVITGEFKEENVWRYHGTCFGSKSNWTSNIHNAFRYNTEEKIKESIQNILNEHSATLMGKGKVITQDGLPDNLKVIKLETSISDTNIISDNFLKDIRQKSALRKLTSQEIIDLGLEEIAVLHKLSDDENNELEMFEDIPF